MDNIGIIDNLRDVKVFQRLQNDLRENKAIIKKLARNKISAEKRARLLERQKKLGLLVHQRCQQLQP